MKILFFVGRQHHAQKLSNIVRLLSERQHDVRLVIATNSINIDPSSEFIWRYTRNVAHVYDYFDRDSMRQIDTITSELKSFSVHDELIRYIAPFWTTQSIREAAECLVGFRNMIQVEKPDAVFALHSNNMFGRIFLYVAQSLGVSTYATQEGLLRHRDQQTQNKQSSSLDYVNTLFTWSHSDKQAYIDAGIDEQRIVPVGAFHLDRYVQAKRHESYNAVREGFIRSIGLNPQRPVVSFMPPTINRYEGDFVRALNELGSWCQANMVQSVVRLHPFDYVNLEQVQRIVQSYGAIVYQHDDGESLVAFSDVVISQQSSVAYEALLLGTPLIELDLDRVGVLESFARQGLATLVEDGQLNRIADVLNGQLSPERVDEWMATNGQLTEGHATERVVNYLEGHHA
jgi:hypothetical protein